MRLETRMASDPRRATGSHVQRKLLAAARQRLRLTSLVPSSAARGPILQHQTELSVVPTANFWGWGMPQDSFQLKIGQLLM